MAETPTFGRYAEIPREMLLRGEWIVPYLQGEPYLDKPPLLYWLVGLSYRLFGIHDWSARLVPALAVHGMSEVRAWFTQPGAVVMSASLERELGVRSDGHFQLAVGGVPHQAVLIARLADADAGPGFDALVLTDIAQAQSVLQLYARAVTLMGPAGAGQLTKMVNQICIAGMVQAL